MQFFCLAATLYVFVLDDVYYYIDTANTTISSATFTDEVRITLMDTYIEPIWYLTAITTILSGIGYLDGSGLKKIKEKAISLAHTKTAKVVAIAHKNKNKAIEMSNYLQNRKKKRKGKENTRES